VADFHVGGPVPLGSVAYAERAFEDGVLTELRAGRWVLLLGPRQHGKTSALLRIRRELRESGYRCALISLQSLPPFDHYAELLSWFARRAATDLGVELAQPAGDAAKDLSEWMAPLITDADPSVIIVDEASGIANDEWRNSFFGQLRSLGQDLSGRGDARRLVFAFSGTFRPETLVDARNSPFNVCQRVDSDDLSIAAAEELWARVTNEAVPPEVGAAFAVVGGQPYLLQRLYAAVAAAEPDERPEVLASALEVLRQGGDDHFEGVFGKIFPDRTLTDIVHRIVVDGSIPNEPANADFRYLQVIGFAVRDEDRLRFRYPIYREFAATSRQLSEAARDLGRISLIAPAPDSYDHMAREELAEIGLSAHIAGIRAYNAGSYRMALIGFGSALESLLIDALLQLSEGQLDEAIRASRARLQDREDPHDPLTWRLVTLVKAAGAAALGVRRFEPPDSLRDWRNQAHPSVALANYLPSERMEPEAIAASGLLSAVLRDLRSGV
jgi:hypothetical protein